MKLTYIGHACFKITTASGFTWITDPFDPTTGLRLPPLECDVCTTSHSHFDHNYTAGLRRADSVLSIAGEYEINDYRFNLLRSYHDMSQGSKRGPNLVTVFEGDGLKLCHMGDIGHVPDAALLNAIGEPDLLMLPIGGTYTIDARTAAQVVRMIMPKAVVPMHYAVPGLNVNVAGPEEFLKLVGSHLEFGPELEITPQTRGILLMTPLAKGDG